MAEWEASGIPAAAGNTIFYDIYPGLGLGEGTVAAGWLDNAVDFRQENI